MKITAQHEIVSIVNDQVKETVEFWAREGWVSEEWIPSVRIDFLIYRSRSRGGRGGYGKDFISLETSRYLDGTLTGFKEYKRFEKDPEIGDVVDDRPRAIRTMVIHELCHALQYSKFSRAVAKMIGVEDPTQKKGHKLLWQTMYRLTRRALVNPQDTPQIDATAKKDKKVEVEPHNVYASLKAPLKRKEAYEEIKKLLVIGYTRKQARAYLTVVHGMNQSTATVYVSQVTAEEVANTPLPYTTEKPVEVK